jgi:hypothetical protein
MKRKKPQDVVLRLGSFHGKRFAGSGRGIGGRIEVSVKPKAEGGELSVHVRL